MSTGVYDRACPSSPVSAPSSDRCDRSGYPCPRWPRCPNRPTRRRVRSRPARRCRRASPSLAWRSCAPRGRSNGSRTCWCSRRRRPPACSTEADVLLETLRRVRRLLPRGERHLLPQRRRSTPRPTASTRRSGHRPVAAGELSVRTGAGRSAVVLIVAALAIAAPINDGKLAARRRRLHRGHRRRTALWLKHEPVVDLGRGRRRLRLPGHRRRRRHRRPALGLVPHRGRRGIAVHGHRQAARRAGRARRRVAPVTAARSPSTPTPYLSYVRAVVVGRADHRVLPLGVRERDRHRRHVLVPALDRPVRRWPSCATRCSSSRAAAARPRRSCSATACSRCSACSGWSSFGIGVAWLTGDGATRCSPGGAAPRRPRPTWSTPATPTIVDDAPGRTPGDAGVIARGLGRSYGDAAQNAGGTVLDTTAPRRACIDLDAATGVAPVEAGISLDALHAPRRSRSAGSCPSRPARATSPSAARSPPTSTARTTTSTAASPTT